VLQLWAVGPHPVRLWKDGKVQHMCGHTPNHTSGYGGLAYLDAWTEVH